MFVKAAKATSVFYVSHERRPLFTDGCVQREMIVIFEPVPSLISIHVCKLNRIKTV